MPNNDSSQDGVILAIDLLLVFRSKTRKWLAEQLGKDQFWIGHRMNNRTMFKFAEIVNIAAVFDLHVEELLAIPEAIPTARSERAAVAS